MEITSEIKAKVFAQYLGQKVLAIDKHGEEKEAIVTSYWLPAGANYKTGMWVCSLEATENREYGCQADMDKCKLILKPLSSITKKDAKRLIQILFSDSEYKISLKEIDIDIHLGDGGNFVDADMILVIEIICRCFEGQLAIRKCGSLLLFDEEGELQPLRNTLLGAQYLQSKGYDLPNYLLDGKTLHEAGLAIYV